MKGGVNSSVEVLIRTSSDTSQIRLQLLSAASAPLRKDAMKDGRCSPASANRMEA